MVHALYWLSVVLAYALIPVVVVAGARALFALPAWVRGCWQNGRVGADDLPGGIFPRRLMLALTAIAGIEVLVQLILPALSRATQ